MHARAEDCPLCADSGGEIVWQDNLCRVLRVDNPDYPGFCRVVWNAHVREMTDLAAADRRHLMSVVFAVEAALRQLYRPLKINLASLGNQVAHVHWHIVPRYADDRHFPEPIWGVAQREPRAPRPPVASRALHDALVAALAEEHAG